MIDRGKVGAVVVGATVPVGAALLGAGVDAHGGRLHRHRTHPSEPTTNPYSHWILHRGWQLGGGDGAADGCCEGPTAGARVADGAAQISWPPEKVAIELVEGVEGDMTLH